MFKWLILTLRLFKLLAYITSISNFSVLLIYRYIQISLNPYTHIIVKALFQQMNN